MPRSSPPGHARQRPGQAAARPPDPRPGAARLAARHLKSERLEQTAIPLHLVAFDLLAGTEVGLSDGPLADAVLAAAAIPRVLPRVPAGAVGSRRRRDRRQHPGLIRRRARRI